MKRLACILFLATTVLVARAQVTPADGQVWWGMWNTPQGLAPVADFSAGANNCAIRLLGSSHPRLRDCQVHGLRFFLSDKTAITAARAWLSINRFDGATGTPDGAVKDIPLTDLRDWQHDGAPTEVLFDEACAILPARNPYASIYAGFTFTLADGGSCAMLAQESGTAAANSNLYGFTDVSATYGALPLQLLVSGTALLPHAAEATTLDGPTAFSSQPFAPILTLTADGTQPITDIDCVLSIGDAVQARQHIVLERPLTELGAQAQVALDAEAPSTPQHHVCRVEVTHVNGQENQSATPALESPLLVLEQAGHKRALLEEFTGTWCPNCVRGITGLHLLDSLFGERFIGIAVHNDDPMTISSYDGSTIVRQKVAKLGGYPSSTIDRHIDGDPYMGQSREYHFTTDQNVAQALQEVAVADVALTAYWADATETTIAWDAQTTFWYNATEAPYALMLVLTADSLTGEGKAWAQVNGLTGQTTLDADLAQFTYGERYMPLAYNHVAVFVDGVNRGIDGSIQTPLVSGQTQHFRYTTSASQVTSTYSATAGQSLIQTPTKLHAVAALIDQNDGHIVNAAKTHVLPYDPTGVARPTTADGVPEAVYDLLGRPAVRTRHGLHLVRSADGSVRKLWR